MKKTTFKRMLATMTLSATLCTVGGVALTLEQASADGTTVTTNAAVAVVDGASLRVEGTFGLRFKTTIAQSYWQEGMEVHTLMAPTSYLDGAELVVNPSDTMIKDYTLDAEKMYSKGEDYYFNTVLTQIPETQYGTEISMRAYVKNGETVVYSVTTTSKSVAGVANAALEYNFDAYKDSVAEYLVAGLTVTETLAADIGCGESYVGAALNYVDGTSTTVAEQLAALYPITYTSDNEGVATVNENGKVTAVSYGTANVTATVEALGISKTCVVTVAKTAYNKIMNFEALNLSRLKGGSNHTSGTDANGSYAQVTIENGMQFGFEVASADMERLNSFDWLQIKLYADAQYGSGTVNCRPLALSKTINNKTLTTVVYNRNEKDDPANAFFVQENFPIYGAPPQITFTNWLGNGTYKIYDITFGYNDIALDNESNTSVNLLEKFGLTATELTNVKFEGVAVENVTAFAPGASGTLTFDVAKEGFETTSFSVAVTYTSLLEWGEVFNFDTPDDTKLVKGNLASLTVIEKDGQNVIAATGSSTTAGDFLTFFITPPTAFTTYAANFDNISIEANGSRADNYGFYGGWTTGTSSMLKTSKYTYTTDKLANVADNGNLKINYSHGAGDVLTMYIYSIKFGFKDIAADDTNTTFDLTTLFRATATELQDVKFNGTGVDDVTAFVPEESGTLTFTIKKEGYKASAFTVNVTKA